MCINQQKQGICPTNIIEHKIYNHSSNMTSNKFIVKNDVFVNDSDNKSMNQISIAGRVANICPTCPPGIVVKKLILIHLGFNIYIFMKIDLILF